MQVKTQLYWYLILSAARNSVNRSMSSLQNENTQEKIDLFLKN